MKTYNETINGSDINELRNLSIELKLEGFGAFSAHDMYRVLDAYKDGIENDAALENINIDGAKAVETVNGMRFVFVYRSGDWMLKSIKGNSNTDRDGIILTLKQEALKVRAQRKMLSGRFGINHTPDIAGQMFAA